MISRGPRSCAGPWLGPRGLGRAAPADGRCAAGWPRARAGRRRAGGGLGRLRVRDKDRGERPEERKKGKRKKKGRKKKQKKNGENEQQKQNGLGRLRCGATLDQRRCLGRVCRAARSPVVRRRAPWRRCRSTCSSFLSHFGKAPRVRSALRGTRGTARAPGRRAGASRRRRASTATSSASPRRALGRSEEARAHRLRRKKQEMQKEETETDD